MGDENMNIDFNEAVEMLEDGIPIILECNGYDYEVSPADDWVGGDGIEGYISLVLGNVVYSSAEDVLRQSIDFLKRKGNEVLINS